MVTEPHPFPVVCEQESQPSGSSIAGMLPRHVEHFWRQVDRSGCCCWLWTGHLNLGYGRFKYRLGPNDCRSSQAHRVAYELLVGPIPEGLHLDHLCRVRNCVNPAHLEPVTPAENTHRSLRSRGAEIDKCINGHEKTPENTYVAPKTGAKACRICRREVNRRREATRPKRDRRRSA